ncbi:MAG TPA: DUF3060 domain-containing protein [Pyrinomonadaceae bacterium]|nr:DUF3060 domain-containing protein [Pyrinomonadaceae bacterium]
MQIKTFFIFTLIIFLSGCNYQFREVPKSSENARTNETNQQNAEVANKTGNSAANSMEGEKPASEKDQPVEGGNLTLSDVGKTAVYPCQGREIEIVEEATANSYTFTGECPKLIVNGVSNKIFVEKVGEVVVSGISNKITYGEGIGGKKPKITKSGTHTDVYQKGSPEEKKATESKH